MRLKRIISIMHEESIGLRYSLLARSNLFMKGGGFMNMGYWRNSPSSLDEACQAMAVLVGEKGSFGPQDRILAVGSGFGEEALLWLRRYQPGKIIGMDVAGRQVRAARARALAVGVADKVEFIRGSATAMALPDRSFDKVVSVEAAFHFATRVDFFREAFRVLRSGGRLVLTDLIPRAEGGHLLQKVSSASNIYGRETYLDHLRAIGFSDIAMMSIRNDVLDPYRRHVTWRLNDPETRGGGNPLSRWLLRKATDPAVYEGLDYILLTASR